MPHRSTYIRTGGNMKESGTKRIFIEGLKRIAGSMLGSMGIRGGYWVMPSLY